METGLKYDYADRTNAIHYQLLNNGKWIKDAGVTNHMHYNEQILAAYIQASKKFHSISANAGILVLKNCEAGHIKKPSDKNHKRKPVKL